jgi:DhnA family fructose-bisphosphate aldolase class Ia
VRASWTNALRGEGFVLPPETIEYLPLIEPEEGLDLGASALVIHFLLGFSEEIDAQCVKFTVQMGLLGASIEMPLIVDVQPVGPRVVLRSKAIELGVSYALEGGADGVVIPWPGGDSYANIHKMAAGAPVWVRPESLDPQDSMLAEALELGASGMWLDERLFADDHPPGLVQAFQSGLHDRVAEASQEV